MDIKKILREELSKQTVLPKVFYHGTNVMFDNFNSESLSKNFEQSILGFYFTQYLKPPPFGTTAKEYAEEAVRNFGGSPIVYEVKLNIKNPLFINSNGLHSSVTAIDKQRNDIKRQLSTSNYDAVVAYDFEEKDFNDKDYSAVVLNSNQIEIIRVIQL